MAEPRKVQFVTLSAFAAGSATESRKQRRLEEDDEEDEEEAEDDVNFDEDSGEEEEVDDDGAATAAAAAATAGAGGVVVGNNGRLDLRDNKAEGKKITMRLNLSLREPSDHASAEFNYGELIKNIQKRNNPPIQKNPPIQNPPIQNPGLNSSDPFNDDERERLQLEALAKKFEDKYSNSTAGKKKDRMQDLIDIGFGYDETDPFIDNSEAYDELVPASLTTKLGGFYINTGTLQFRPASDTEGEEGAKIVIDDDDDDDEKVIKRRKKKEVNSLEEKKPRKNRVPKQGGLPLNLHRPEKKKRKKLMKDSLCLAAMLRRFTREKEELRKRNPNALQTGLPNNPHSVASTNLLLASNSHLLLGNVANSDNVSLADLTSDPAMVSLLGSASEKELQDLLGDLDFSLLDSAPQHAMAAARENGLLGVGVPANKAASGGQARGLGASSGPFSPPPLPDGVPAPLIKRIEDLRTASRQFDQEGRKKFFTLDMNNILLDIELQVQEQPQEVRSGIYSHLEAFVPCNKEALLKRLKKLSINIQDDRLRTPLLKLKLAVCSVMPEQIQRYNMDCIAKAAKQQSEEGEKNGSEEEDEEKPGKRVMGPRKKFVWDDKLRSLLCSLVRVKLSCYELENQCSLTVEEYLKAFMENEVKPLWPKGWMQARILLKESRVVHGHLTGNLVKRRMVPGPRAKAKDGPWIQRPLLSMATTTAMGTSMPHLPAGQRPSSPSEPICLSDSLDEDLTAPSLDSISHALALYGGSSKGMGHSDSPLSPPPLQMPTSSPPSVTPHYSSTTQLSASVTSSAQHSLSKTETVPLAGMPTTTPPSAISTSSSSSSSTPSTSASMARLQMAGSSSSLASRALDVTYGLIKGSSAASQNQRHVTMVTPTHRPGSAMGGSSNKLHPLPSPSPPKQRPPPTSSPLLPPHQKGFGSSPGVVASNPHGLAKNSAKASSVSSNGGAMSCSIPTSSSSSRSNSNNSHQCLRTFSPVVAFSTSHSPQGKSHPLPGQQQTQHHLHQANFITPMQATLTKSSHSSNASPIIKLTPRPPAPTPPPSSSSSSPSPSSSPSNSLSHQYSAKSPGFRPPFSGGQGKQSQGNYGFAGGQKAQSVAGSSSVNNGSNSSNHGNMGVVVSSRQELTPSPSSLVSANHGQRQRAAGGAGQGSKAGGGRVSSGALSTPSAVAHLAQVSSAGSALLGSSAALPLSFGMLGGLVPVTLPFQFPSLLNFTAPGAPGVGSMGTVASANSGYSLSPNELMDLYKSLQSGAQAALPPHLQLAFSDANQSQGGDMKRKTH